MSLSCHPATTTARRDDLWQRVGSHALKFELLIITRANSVSIGDRKAVFNLRFIKSQETHGIALTYRKRECYRWSNAHKLPRTSFVADVDGTEILAADDCLPRKFLSLTINKRRSARPRRRSCQPEDSSPNRLYLR